ncbi:hypothetical protein NITMOv2_3623 [Nitrospira moscoviensis]|uniref:Uncharacterized protein n=1 Tax=Nitrospira moscoviensis TaxID=42253 RepID=A0A0K2GGD2_NITMO|nr:hypothetical protein NITMOv2_3623 [Nitrospira moscoviensis]
MVIRGLLFFSADPVSEKPRRKLAGLQFREAGVYNPQEHSSENRGFTR